MWEVVECLGVVEGMGQGIKSSTTDSAGAHHWKALKALPGGMGLLCPACWPTLVQVSFEWEAKKNWEPREQALMSHQLMQTGTSEMAAEEGFPVP